MSGGIKVGKKLKEARVRSLLTQEELADMAGVSAGTIVKIEREQVDPHFSTIRKLARALDIDPPSLLEE